ncbi:glycoside hydrolase family 3 C-terminal domain-containing protein [Saccharothrix sp. 6-C]|uniref:glycoside hydrolase family 3 protein n=1 Tax=Saccharothrix sp. 6-C TaxID=2781735 RepID=UPI0019176D04|nr:glycoside hydrolase family 3 protein [Saccharothrix sp. 6-C]QQQ73692.1 glycoside hydrolase family 3 C-terminal domain-containing protein [Saccharothrix sp. 6-C]
MRKIFNRRQVLVGVSALLVASAPAVTASATGDVVADAVRRMSLEEKVGQLFVTYAYGATVDTADPASVAANRRQHGVDNAEQLIGKYHLGGIIYFAWSGNTADPAQVAALSNGIQRVSSIPALVSTDQEYGVVSRIGEPVTPFPGNMALGAARDPEAAGEAALIAGRELRAMGVNQDFAPVADVNVNALNPVIGVRSFAEDPELTARLVEAQVRGYERGGVSATAKHFPGHGDTAVDSHTGLPVIGHSREDWERLDAPPFRRAIAAGIDSIMTAHIVVLALDPAGDPATLSRPIITGILRDRLGYDGVVVTDSLGMAGVRQKYGDDRVPVLALKAGVDQLLMPPNIDLAFNAVLAAVRGGELTERRIDQSVRRILRMKAKRGLFDDRFVDPAKLPEIVGTTPNKQAAQRITDRTTTLVRNEVLPLRTPPASVFTTGWGTTADPVPQRLATAVSRRAATADALATGANPNQATIDRAVAGANAADLTIVATNRAWTDVGQQNLVKALLATGKPVVVIAVRDPYDIAYFPEARTYLATYSYTEVSMESAVRVLYGEHAPVGKLPVTIPVAGDPSTALHPFGHGLTWEG